MENQIYLLASSMKWISPGQLYKKNKLFFQKSLWDNLIKKIFFSKIGMGQLYKKNKFLQNWPGTTLQKKIIFSRIDLGQLKKNLNKSKKLVKLP